MGKICLGNTEKYQFSLIKQFQIFFSVSQPLIFFKCLRQSGRYVTRLQCEKGKVPSYSLVWGPLGENMSRKRLKSDFLIISQFQIFFSVSRPLIFLKCLCLSGKYVDRLQWEQGYITSHSLVWGHKGKNISRKWRKIAIFSYKAISNIFFCISASFFLKIFMSAR